MIGVGMEIVPMLTPRIQHKGWAWVEIIEQMGYEEQQRFREPPVRYLPESDAARAFNAEVDALLASPSSTSAHLRATLTRWRDNDAKLRPLLDRSFLLKENAALSATLSQIGATGLQALDYLEHETPAAADWKSAQLSMLQEAAKPRSQLLLMIVPGVQRLVQGKSASH